MIVDGADALDLGEQIRIGRRLRAGRATGDREGGRDGDDREQTGLASVPDMISDSCGILSF